MSAGHTPPQRAHTQSDTPAETPEAEGFLPILEEPRPDPGGLAERLSAITLDRASSAARIAQETASVLRGWLRDRQPGTALDGTELERELAAWADDQAWRGPCALWLDSLRRTWNAGAGSLLADELGWEMDEWLRGDGRLASRRDLAGRAAGDVEPGESVLVTAWSESVALALETAWRAGRDPEVFVGEGSPDLDGRRMARRLAHAGLRVTMAYDCALTALVPRVDRVWLSTEGIGAGTFLARKGTRFLLEECARRDVPVSLLATSDKLVPGGALRLPAWCERESWRLWEDAPEGVRLEPQTFEFVPIELLELVGGILTEIGRETAAGLHLRSLRVEAAPACDAGASSACAMIPEPRA